MEVQSLNPANRTDAVGADGVVGRGGCVTQLIWVVKPQETVRLDSFDLKVGHQISELLSVDPHREPIQNPRECVRDYSYNAVVAGLQAAPSPPRLQLLGVFFRVRTP